MTITKPFLAIILTAILMFSAWACNTMLDVKDRLTKIETTIKILLPDHPPTR